MDEDFFELLAVADVESDFYAGVEMLAGALERADVGVGDADGGGDFGEHSGAIFGEQAQADRESGFGSAGPFGGDAALGFIEEILDVGARGGVHRDASTARDVADNVVSGNGIAALGAINHQVIVSADLNGRVLHAQHALYGGNDLRRFFLSGLGQRLMGSFGEHLSGGPFAVAEVGIEVVNTTAAVIGGDALSVLAGDFLQTDAAVARFAFEEAAADGGGFLVLVEINPVADFAAAA